MEKQLIVRLHTDFERNAHTENGIEFWYARELQGLLGYDRWENFENAIHKAKIACTNAKQAVFDHFRDVTKMIQMPKGASKDIADIVLSRYACYLIAQNGDPRKDEIAFAQTYFAVQTRNQEIVERRLNELDRVHAREKLTTSEKELSGILFERGVDGQGFARIRSKGDRALFGGCSTQDMKEKLAIPEKRALADFLPTVTIKAKDLATEITNHNVKQTVELRGETDITFEHVRNNENVREVLTKSGIHPENLPREEDVKKLQSRMKKDGVLLAKKTGKLKK